MTDFPIPFPGVTPDSVEVIGAESSAGRKLKIFTADSLAGIPVPERHWLVPGMIPMSRVTLLYANGGEGKSLLNIQLGVAVATGGDWIGNLVERGRVLILSAEDDKDEAHRRLADIVRGRDFGLKDLYDLRIVDLVGEEAILAFPESRGTILKTSPLFAEIEQEVCEWRPIMLGIDTLSMAAMKISVRRCGNS